MPVVTKRKFFFARDVTLSYLILSYLISSYLILSYLISSVALPEFFVKYSAACVAVEDSDSEGDSEVEEV